MKVIRVSSGRRHSSAGRVIVALLALLTTGLLAASSSAQVLYGSVVGVVQDAQGSSIPGRDRDNREQGHQSHRETVSNENGEYKLPNVLPGRYDVKVACRGSGSS